MQGASNFLWVPLANTFGRRPIMLISLLMLVFFSMWAGLAKDFSSLLAARFFMGFSNGPADTIAPDIIGEIYFVHQRGRAMVSTITSFICRVTADETAKGHLYRLPSMWTPPRRDSRRLHRRRFGNRLDPLGQRDPRSHNAGPLLSVPARDAIRPYRNYGDCRQQLD